MQHLKKHKWLIGILLIFLNIFVWLHLLQASETSTLTVAMLDIGQGDAIYIEAPNGRQMMIDGGPDKTTIRRLGEVMPFGDKSIDVLLITNPDKDHMAGFADVIEGYEVGLVVEPGTITDTKIYQTIEEEIAAHHIPNVIARRGMKIMLDEKAGVYFEILFPDRDVSTWTTNDGSVIGKLVYGKSSMMFTGDASKLTESIVLSENTPENLKSDILKVGHHGSRTSTSLGFVQAVAPMYAAISDGKNNKYGHPHQETLDTLNQSGVQVFRTDMLGTIIFKGNGENWKVD